MEGRREWEGGGGGEVRRAYWSLVTDHLTWVTCARALSRSRPLLRVLGCYGF